MGKTYAALDERLIEFITRQHVFFVGTAPLGREGLLNISPKGLGGLAIVDPHTVAYLDLTGSGIETVSHLRENGRIVIMFCAFEGPPKILRLHDRGEVIVPADAEFRALAARFPAHPGARSITRVAMRADRRLLWLRRAPDALRAGSRTVDPVGGAERPRGPGRLQRARRRLDKGHELGRRVCSRTFIESSCRTRGSSRSTARRCQPKRRLAPQRPDHVRTSSHTPPV